MGGSSGKWDRGKGREEASPDLFEEFEGWILRIELLLEGVDWFQCTMSALE